MAGDDIRSFATRTHDHSQAYESAPALDHGAATGLGDDDHTQYLLADGTRALSGTMNVTGGLDVEDGTLQLPAYQVGGSLPYEFWAVEDGVGNFVGALKLWDGSSAYEFIPAASTAPEDLAFGDVASSGGGAVVTEVAWIDHVHGMPSLSDIDHGSITGLGDDDHTQYWLANGSRDISGNVTLSADSTYAIFETAVRPTNIFTDLLTTPGIAFPSTQISSSDVNTLDDYEEGSWTPAWYNNGGSGSPDHSRQEGRYVKIGRWVFFSGNLIGGKGTMTSGSDMRISGLPFTASTTMTEYPVWFSYYNGFQNLGTYHHLTGAISASATTISLSWNQNSGGAIINATPGYDFLVAGSASNTVFFGGAYEAAT